MTTTCTLIRTLLAVTVLATAASLVSPAATLAGGVPRSSCPVGMVCNTAIGVAVRLPRGWTVEPPGHSAFNSLTLGTIVPGRQNMDLHMDIEPFGTTTARDPLAAAEAGADAAAQGVTISVTRTAMAVAGVPAVRLRGLGGAPDFGQEIVVAHGGLLYGIYTFDKSRTAFTPGQRQALASLRFIPRHGPALRPYGTNALVAALYNPCLDLQRTPPAAVPAAARLTVSFSISPARGNEMVGASVSGTGLRPGQEMVLTACWNRAVHPTYAWYHKIAHVHANRYGALPAPTATPTFVMYVPSGSFKSWDVRVVATDARTGQRLAAVDVGPSTSVAAPHVHVLRLLSQRPLTHDGGARFLAWGPRAICCSTSTAAPCGSRTCVAGSAGNSWAGRWPMRPSRLMARTSSTGP